MRASRPATRALRLLAATLTLASCAAAPTVARADGGVGYRVDGDPGSVIDGGFIKLSASPGGSTSGHFFATNSGTSAAQVSVYSADGLTGDTSGIVYSDAGTALADAGGWMSLSTNLTGLAANDSRRIDFTVRVPSGATPGDHVGGIVLEQRRSGNAISQVVRNVVPVLIDVSGSAGPALSLRSAMVSALPGTSLPAVTVKMVNTGTRICSPLLTVALVGPSERGSAVTRQLDAILPGDSVPYPMPWPRAMDAGTYTASVSASGCGATVNLRTDVHNDITAESTNPAGQNAGTDKTDVVTKAPPSASHFTAPKHTTKDAGADKSSNASGGSGTGSGSGSSGGPAAPVGAAGSGGGQASAGGILHKPTLSKLGDVAIKYLPPLLERLIAPLSLLGLMLLFLFAQESFDRKDPKLALAPIHRDPDLEFLPIDEVDAAGANPANAPDLSVVRSPTPGRPVTG